MRTESPASIREFPGRDKMSGAEQFQIYALRVQGGRGKRRTSEHVCSACGKNGSELLLLRSEPAATTTFERT